MVTNLRTLGLLALTLLFVLGLAGCNGSSSSSHDDVKIRILHTTDTHGSLFPYDFIEQSESANSLAQVYTYVKQQRAEYENVLLFSAGDILQGQPVTNYYNYEVDPATTNHAVADVMNYMGYDAIVVGNHDIEPGHNVYDNVANQFKCPLLSANTVATATGEPYFPAYTMFNKGGAKIAVIGLTTPGIPKWLPESVWSGLTFEDMIETAQYWMNYVKQHEEPDMIIGVFHSGKDYTYGGVTAETPKNENASLLVARQVPGFDIIYMGHDHMDWDYVDEESGVLMMGGKNAAVTVTGVTVDLVWNEETESYDKAFQHELIKPADLEADADFMATFDPQFSATQNYVGELVGTFTEATSSRDAMFGDSTFNDLIHDLQFKVAEDVVGMPCNVSFAAPLQFDKTIEAGPVYISDMYKLYKYENWMYVMELTGAEIKGHLEYSYAKWTNQMTSADDHLINFTNYDEATGNYDLAARYYNYDTAAGIIYEVDVTKPEYERVNILSMADGSAFDLNATYRCAVNSYRAGGGGGHLTSGAGIASEDLEARTIGKTARDLRYYLAEQIKEMGSVTPMAFGNWKFVPEDWAAAGAARDREILYGSGDGAH